MADPSNNMVNDYTYNNVVNNPNAYVFYSHHDRKEIARMMKQCMKLKCKKVRSVQSNYKGMSWKCVERECTFYHYAKRNEDGMFSTFKSHPHSCAKIYSPRLSTAEAKRILEENRPLMQLSVADSRQTIQTLAGGQISNRSLARARSGVTQDLDESGMAKLRSYITKFTHANPGSIYEVEIDEQHKLNHLFMCPSISRDVIRSSLPLICIDATHSLILSSHKIYTAVTVDCNNHTTVCCFGVFPQESTEAWTKFIQLMKRGLELEDVPGVVVFSDRNPGLVRAIGEVLPGVTHSLCAFHIDGNFKKKFGVDRDRIAIRLAHTRSRSDYEDILASLDNASEREYLANIDPAKYCLFAMSDARFGRVATSVAEGINGAILKLRSYPVLFFVVEMIAFISKSLMNGRKDLLQLRAANNNMLPLLSPKNQTILLSNITSACSLSRRMMSDGRYCVSKSASVFWHVDMSTKTCSCIEFQETGIPCVHACTVINTDFDGQVHNYIHPQQLLRSVEHLYSSSINEVTLDDLEQDEVRPMLDGVRVGRRHTRRIPSEGEGVVKKYKCCFCHSSNHTRPRCDLAREQRGDDPDGQGPGIAV